MSTPAPPPVLSGTPPSAAPGTPPRADGRPPQQSSVTWSIVCLMMAVFINLPLLGKSPAAFRALMPLHAVETAICLVGFAAALLWERKQERDIRPPAQNSDGVAANSWAMGVVPDALFVAYASRRSDMLQADWHNILTNRRVQLGLIQFPVFTMIWTVGAGINRVSGIELAARILLTLIGCGLFLFVLTMFTVWQRYPKADSERPGMIYLCADGVYDYVSEKTLFVPWRMVSGISRARGNVFIQSKQTHLHGLTFPTSAFPDEASSERFIAAATQLWKGNGDLHAIAPEVRAEFAPPSSSE